MMITRKPRSRGQRKEFLVFYAVTFCAFAVAVGIGSQTLRKFGTTTLNATKARFSTVRDHHDNMMLPNVMLWAWERAEDLRGLDTQKAGVAFLAGTIFLRPIPPNGEKDLEEGVVLRPRLQPLYVPDGIGLMAVVRIETQKGWSQAGYQPAGQPELPQGSDPYTEAQRVRTVSMISGLVSHQGARAVQIDFDATRSEQAFYRSLLEDLRKRLPPTMPISITALASWCIGDPWLEQLPSGTINEAVPMLFRMGPDAANVASFLSKGNEFRVPVCRGSLGVSTDESFSKEILNGDLEKGTDRWKKKRIYVFHAKAWSEASLEQTIGALHKWHKELFPL